MYHYPPDARRAIQTTDTYHALGEFNPRFCGAVELGSISPAKIFSSTVHGAFFLIFQKEWGVHSAPQSGVLYRQVCRPPAVIHRTSRGGPPPYGLPPDFVVE